MEDKNDLQRENELLKTLGDIMSVLVREPTHLILLFFSCIFVIFSIINGRYIFETFWTLFYAVAMNYLMIARKHESIGNYLVRVRSRLFCYIFILLLVFIAWVTIITLHLLGRF
ncbi:MAG: hypothetical protein Q8N73_00775 [bacterium]|nr:hypothetical protein [bacterium]